MVDAGCKYRRLGAFSFQKAIHSEAMALFALLVAFVILFGLPILGG